MKAEAIETATQLNALRSKARTTILIRELLSKQCRCGEPKRPMRTFCLACFRALPRELQIRLYNRIGEGYEEACAEAVEILRSKKIA